MEIIGNTNSQNVLGKALGVYQPLSTCYLPYLSYWIDDVLVSAKLKCTQIRIPQGYEIPDTNIEGHWAYPHPKWFFNESRSIGMQRCGPQQILSTSLFIQMHFDPSSERLNVTFKNLKTQNLRGSETS